MDLKLAFTIAFSKLLIFFCRLTRRGGTTLPGKIANKLYPGILKVLTADVKIIMVTGTNGKTTTTRIIGQTLKENGIDYFTNKSGANLLSGITTTFIEAAGLSGRCITNTALIEADEAAFNVACDYMEPDIVIVTNFFRDQLDRYGELYSTLNSVKSGLSKLSKARLVLNADDSLCASLGRDTGKETLYYGFSAGSYEGVEESVNTDAMFCRYCKTKYTYSYHIYGHLGGFRCPDCGYERPDTAITCTKVVELTSASTKIEFSDGYSEYNAEINLPGLYNVYNALAGIGCSRLLQLPVENSIRAVGKFECGFGRMETIKVEGKTIKLILVKNPTGFNQVLNYLLTEDSRMQLAFIINDKLADGTDISWLWDVDFEKLAGIQERMVNIYTSGVRAEDMAVRLKYAGIYTTRLNIEKDYKNLINTGLSNTVDGSCFYILPTYTAMLDIRRILKYSFNLREFWK